MVIKMRKIYAFVAVVSLLLVSGIFAVPKSVREVSGEAHISLPVVMYHQITKISAVQVLTALRSTSLKATLNT